jgi:hypothetical protein
MIMLLLCSRRRVTETLIATPISKVPPPNIFPEHPNIQGVGASYLQEVERLGYMVIEGYEVLGRALRVAGLVEAGEEGLTLFREHLRREVEQARSCGRSRTRSLCLAGRARDSVFWRNRANRRLRAARQHTGVSAGMVAASTYCAGKRRCGSVGA